MAVQDDNTILNKGDLKAYHERIAPMLGGTFMVSTNNSDYYSTDEKVVGVWTDGKPVYQKAINVSSVVLPANQWIDTSISFTCETIVYSKAVWVSRQPSGSVAYQGQSIDVRCTSAGKLSLYTPYGNVNPDYIIVQYTKTTDTAGSALTTPGAYDINFPNTWPANKEIFFGNGMYGYRATGNVASSKDNTLPISGVKKFYGYGGSSDNGAGANVHTFPYTNPGNLPTWGNCLWADHNNGIPHIYWGTGYTTNTTFDVWIKYTK